MSLDRRPRAGRRSSLINASYYRSTGRQPPIHWNLQGVRGQMSSNCLWHACRALFVGILLFGIGTFMCVSGFYADGVFDSNNSTRIYSREMYFRDPSRQVKFSKLSYVGPIVMGVGGFIIVATCVMTFEARDSAAKVGPAAFGTTTSSSNTHPFTNPKNRREVRSVASQTQSSISASTLQLFDRKYIMEAFRKFSKTVRSSASITSWQGDQFHRSPSAPSLLNANVPTRRGSSSNNISSTRRFLQRNRQRIPQALLRQAMSVDCSSNITSSPRLGVNRQNSSTQTLALPQPQQRYNLSNHPHPKIYRSIYSTSSECCPSTTGSIETTLRFENEIAVIKSVNASVHFDPEINSEAVPNGLNTLNVLKPNVLSGSATSLRTLSPHPSCYSDDSMDRVSCKSEQTAAKSPTTSLQKSRLRSAEYSYARPSLLRQSKIDYSGITITCAPLEIDDDETIIVSEEDLSTIPE